MHFSILWRPKRDTILQPIHPAVGKLFAVTFVPIIFGILPAIVRNVTLFYSNSIRVLRGLGPRDERVGYVIQKQTSLCLPWTGYLSITSKKWLGRMIWCQSQMSNICNTDTHLHMSKTHPCPCDPARVELCRWMTSDPIIQYILVTLLKWQWRKESGYDKNRICALVNLNKMKSMLYTWHFHWYVFLEKWQVWKLTGIGWIRDLAVSDW